MVWRVVSGVGSTTSPPTSGPRSSLTTSPSLPALSRPDSRLGRALPSPSAAGSIYPSNSFAPCGGISPRYRQRSIELEAQSALQHQCSPTPPIKTHVHGRTLAKLSYFVGFDA